MTRSHPQPRPYRSARQRKLNTTRRMQHLVRVWGHDKRRVIRRARAEYMPAGRWRSVRRWTRDYGKRAREDAAHQADVAARAAASGGGS